MILARHHERRLRAAQRCGYIVARANRRDGRLLAAWCAWCEGEGRPDVIVVPRVTRALVRLDLAGTGLEIDEIDQLAARLYLAAAGRGVTVSPTYVGAQSVSREHAGQTAAWLVRLAARARRAAA